MNWIWVFEEFEAWFVEDADDELELKLEGEKYGGIKKDISVGEFDFLV